MLFVFIFGKEGENRRFVVYVRIVLFKFKCLYIDFGFNEKKNYFFYYFFIVNNFWDRIIFCEFFFSIE